MDRFADAGPIAGVGSVIERRQIARFFAGLTALLAIILLITALGVLLFTHVTPPSSTYIGIAVVSILGGLGGTLLAVRHNSPAVFVPYLKVTPEDDRQIFRSPEKIDGQNYAYYVSIPTDTPEYVIWYKGLGETPEEIHLLNSRQQEKSQVEFDSEHLVEITQPVYFRE